MGRLRGAAQVLVEHVREVLGRRRAEHPVHHLALAEQRHGRDGPDAIPGSQRGLLHYSTALNELRFSRDPVVLDVLSLQELDRQRRAAGMPAAKTNLDLYRNASLLELGVSDLRKIHIETLRP